MTIILLSAEQFYCFSNCSVLLFYGSLQYVYFIRTFFAIIIFLLELFSILLTNTFTNDTILKRRDLRNRLS